MRRDDPAPRLETVPTRIAGRTAASSKDPWRAAKIDVLRCRDRRRAVLAGALAGDVDQRRAGARLQQGDFRLLALERAAQPSQPAHRGGIAHAQDDAIETRELAAWSQPRTADHPDAGVRRIPALSLAAPLAIDGCPA